MSNKRISVSATPGTRSSPSKQRLKQKPLRVPASIVPADAGGATALIALMIPVVIAAAARLYHLDHGLPGVVYVDAFKFVDEAVRMVSTPTLKAQEFQYPGFFANLLASLYYMGGIVSRYWQHFTANLVSAGAGIGLTVLIYRAALSMSGSTASLLAATLWAVCITSITESRIAAPDALMVLLMMLSLFLLLEGEPTLGRFAFSGAMAGLAIGCKWTALYNLPWIAVAAWLFDEARSTRKIVRRVLVACSTCLAALALSSPGLLLSPARFFERLGIELEIQRYGQIGRVQLGFLDYFTSPTPTWEQPWLGTSFISNYGILLTILALVALGFGLSGRMGRRPAFLAAYTAIYLLFISGPGRVRAFRFVLPVLPVIYALIGCFVETVLFARIRRYRIAAGVVILAALAFVPTLRSVDYLVRTRQRLTNEDVQEWMTRNIPAGTKILASPLFTDNLRQLPLNVLFLPNAGGLQYRIPGNPHFNGELNPLFPPTLVAQMRAEGIRYVVANSYFNEAYSPIPENLKYFPRSVGGYLNFFRELISESESVFEVRGWSAGRLGPDITVYRLK